MSFSPISFTNFNITNWRPSVFSRRSSSSTSKVAHLAIQNQAEELSSPPKKHVSFDRKTNFKTKQPLTPNQKTKWSYMISKEDREARSPIQINKQDSTTDLFDQTIEAIQNTQKNSKHQYNPKHLGNFKITPYRP